MGTVLDVTNVTLASNRVPARPLGNLDPRDEWPIPGRLGADRQRAPGGAHRRAGAPGRGPAPRPDARGPPGHVAAQRRRPGRLRRRRRAPLARRGPVRRGQRVVARDHQPGHRAQRRRRAGQRPGRVRHVRVRRRAGRLRARRAGGDPRSPRRPRLAHHRLERRRPRQAGPPPRAGHHAARAGRRPLHRRRDGRRAVDGAASATPSAASTPASSRRSSWPATWSPPPTSRSTSAGRCASWPPTTRPAGPSTSTACSAPPPSCSSAASAAWSPRGCWPAPSAAPATTPATSRSPPGWPGRSKDLEEHEYAVRSVAEALEPHCSSMNVPEAPFVLHLPNVMHLATDVAGVVHDAATVTSLELVAALHPSAAVGGTPTRDAIRADRRARGHGPRPLRRPGRLDGRRRRRRVGHRAPLGQHRGQHGPALRRLRHRRRLRPRGRAGRDPGQVRARAGLAAGSDGRCRPPDQRALGSRRLRSNRLDHATRVSACPAEPTTTRATRATTRS